MRKRQRPSPLAILLAFAVGSAFAALALALPSGSLERLVHDGCLVLFPRGRTPGDFLVVGPAYPGGTGEKAPPADPGPAEAFEVLGLIDEFRPGPLVIEGEVYGGALEKAELEALRSGLPAVVDRESSQVEENIKALYSGIRTGSIGARDLGRFFDSLAERVRQGGERIKEAASGGDSSSLGRLEAELSILSPRRDSFPAIEPDADGVARRLPIVRRKGESLEARAELAAMMDRLGSREFELKEDSVVILGARLPGGRTGGLSIPVDAEGRVLLAWPRPGSEAAPRQLALGDFIDAAREEEEFVALLRNFDSGGLFVGEGYALLSRYRHAGELREVLLSAPAEARDGARADWREARAAFFAAAEAYFSAGHDDAAVAELEEARANLKLSPDELSLFDERIASVKDHYSQARVALAKLSGDRARLSNAIGGSTIFLSMTSGGGLRPVAGKPVSPAYAGAVFAANLLAASAPRRAPALLEFGMLALAILAASLCAASVGAREGSPRFLPVLAAVVLVLGLCLLAAAASACLFAFSGILVELIPILAGIAAAGLAAFCLAGPRAGVHGNCESLGAGASAVPGSSPRAERKEVAVLACKASGLAREAASAEPAAAALSLAEFRGLVSGVAAAHGGVVADGEGASMALWFQSGEGAEAEKRALDAALELARGAKELQLGLDAGDCLILPSQEGGRACILGSPADLAGRLADLCGHYRSGLIASRAVVEKSGPEREWKSLGELKVESTGREAHIFSIVMK